jgi:2-polyprenyl-6-methoxyphenol hydroxylase-like FAD-dependent oxidoreductase
MVPYDESLTVEQAQRRSRDLFDVVDGAPGVVGVGHPELREALATAATKAGATLIRGERRSVVRGGTNPTVTFDVDGCTRAAQCRLVVGADGKKSATRTGLSLPLSTTHARVRLTGMLVDDGGAWNRAETAISVDGRNQFIVIPRADRRLRLYVARRDDDPEPIQGPSAVVEFLKSFRTPIFPDPDAMVESTPIGPCATFPMNDAWVDEPVVPGVALVGDAAGWSNPVTAQGLAISLRDARILAEAILAGSDWTPRGLAGYGDERRTRMARLRFASAMTDLLTGFGMPDRAARRSRMLGLLRQRPELGAALDAVHAGPWAASSEAYTPDSLTTLALA